MTEVDPMEVWGTVRETTGGVYRVALDDGRSVEASLRGRLKRDGDPEARSGDRVVIGDRVRVCVPEDPTEGATVEAAARRESEIVRRGSGRRAKVVAANVDRLVVVVAAAEPGPRLEVLDRLLALAEADRVEGMVVVNKVDLPDSGDTLARLEDIYSNAGYRVLATSVVDGRGIDALAAVVCSGTSALVGPSGAGKSSLLNAVEPGLELRTGELSRKVGRGRHTTVSSRLISLQCGGAVADTPGFSDVGLFGVEPTEVAGLFPEIRVAEGGCRFRDCAHGAEPECAVRAAVATGAIPESRFRSYLELREECASGLEY